MRIIIRMITKEMIERHEAAIQNKMKVYKCPESGLNVMTSKYLAERGYCCSSGCRHCPYDGWEYSSDDEEHLDEIDEYDYTRQN